MDIVAQTITDGMLQEATNKAVVALVAGLSTWFVRKWYYERQTRQDKLEKTHEALFGVEDVDTMKGVVEIIETHEDDIDRLYQKVEKGKEKRKEIEKKVENLKERVNSRVEGSAEQGENQ